VVDEAHGLCRDEGVAVLHGKSLVQFLCLAEELFCQGCLIGKQLADAVGVTLVAEIDSEFDVAIPAEELVPENFNSAKALYALIERLMDE
jgi:hypothetical protein